MTVLEHVTDVDGRTSGGLVASGIAHAYPTPAGDVVALADLDLDVEEGEMVAVVGQSGCGKSTLLHILAGLMTPTRGTVRVGEPADRSGLPAVGYITQQDSLLPWRSTIHNVALPLELHGIGRSERLERAGALLGRVGLAGFEDRLPHELSGGMRQRAGIARALVYRPTVLFMDEPFGALDAWTRSSLHQLLVEVRHELGTTVILVTHDLVEAVTLADRVLTLAARPGRIVGEYRLAPPGGTRCLQGLPDDPLRLQAYTDIRRDLGLVV